ncbi:MAG: hypothetical protein EOO00_09020, partial [Chitinophagaceae bacterium]
MRKLVLVTLLTAVSYGSNAQQLLTLISKYTADQQMMSRKYPIKYSESYFARMNRFYGEWKSTLSALPYTSYGVNDRVDYQLLKRNIGIDHASLLRGQREQQGVANLFEWSPIVEAFQLDRSVGKVVNGEQLKVKLDQLTAQVKALTTSLSKSAGKNTPEEFAVAERAADQYRRVLTESYKFYEGYDPQFTRTVKESYNKADGVLKSFVSTLNERAIASRQKDDGSGIFGNPIGRDGLIRGLADEMIAYSPEQLQQIALKE